MSGRRKRRGTERRTHPLTVALRGPTGLYARSGKLRAPWRLLAFAILVVAGVLLAMAIAGIAEAAFASFGIRGQARWLIAPAGILAAHVIAVRWMDRDNWSSVGLDLRAANPRAWGPTAALAASAIAVPSLLLVAGGLLDAVPAPDGSSFAVAVNAAPALALAAFAEELLARGYLFAVLREVWGWRWAVVATSAVFGGMHLLNPGAEPQAILNVVLAGFFLGLVLVRTRSLYAAWAAHFAWNWTLVALLHADVSGVTLTPETDYRIVDSGPDWMTGGPWGPEGGAGAALGLAIASSIMLRPLIRRRDQTNG